VQHDEGNVPFAYMAKGNCLKWVENGIFTSSAWKNSKLQHGLVVGLVGAKQFNQ
jgi:hypothetical protein